MITFEAIGLMTTALQNAQKATRDTMGEAANKPRTARALCEASDLLFRTADGEDLTTWFNRATEVICDLEAQAEAFRAGISL